MLLALALSAGAAPASASESRGLEERSLPRWAVGDRAIAPDPRARRRTTSSSVRASGGDPVRRAIVAARDAGAIDPASAERYLDVLSGARRTLARLRGRRRRELGYVLGAVRRVAARGELWSHRLPAAFEMIRRNRQWWGRRGAPSAGRRLRFKPNRLIWQYYPRRGLQLQPLANFARANAYWSRRLPDHSRGMGELLDQILPLAANRAGGIAWEYWFDFGRGRPAWTSAISQGTAIQSLVRGADRLGRPDYLRTAEGALGVFRSRTPTGVRVSLGDGGAWYALYSFWPGLRVLNAHVQALNGLYDLSVAPTPLALEARTHFDAGMRALRSRIRSFDTGSWSKYANPGRVATREYHRLNRDVLQALCDRTADELICSIAARFTRYLRRR